MFARLLFIVCAAPIAILAADDMFVGTWKVSVEKSKTSSGRPVPVSSQTFEAITDGYKITLGDGTVIALQLDGKDRPRIVGSTAKAVGADMANGRRIDARAIETTFKRGGKTVATIKREVSADRRVMTTTSNGVMLSGEKVHDVLVFDKQ